MLLIRPVFKLSAGNVIFTDHPIITADDTINNQLIIPEPTTLNKGNANAEIKVEMNQIRLIRMICKFDRTSVITGNPASLYSSPYFSINSQK